MNSYGDIEQHFSGSDTVRDVVVFRKQGAPRRRLWSGALRRVSRMPSPSSSREPENSDMTPYAIAANRDSLVEKLPRTEGPAALCLYRVPKNL